MTGFSLAGSAARTSAARARDASSIARKRCLMRSLFCPNSWSEYYGTPKKSPAQSSGMQGKADPSAEGDHPDPNQEGNGARDLGAQRRSMRRDTPAVDIAADIQMKDRHVDPRQDQKDELRLKIRIVCIVESVGGKEQDACNRCRHESNPSAAQHVPCQPNDGALARGEADQPQIDDRYGPDHQRNREHMDGLDPGKQGLVLANCR